MPINFRDKLSPLRPYNRSALDTDTSLDIRRLERALESDRGRIVHSAAIRRLQQKTQVFPLERNAAVRSRLTHSLEVQQTGRFLVRTLYDKLGDDAANYGLDGLERAIESLVEMACLMHDVGNPPFGHFGEAAISSWFQQTLPNLEIFRAAAADTVLANELVMDAATFEGNAQAIRLIHSLLGLNLTYAQSACVLKYTRGAHMPKPDKSSAQSYLQKKPGFYLSEQAFVKDMQNQLALESGCRYPLTYLMEAADDISYCLADIEDGVEKGLLSIERLAQLLIDEFDDQQGQADTPWLTGKGTDKRSFRQVISSLLQRAQQEPINKVHEFFVWLRVNLIHPLVQHAAQSFIDNIEAIYHGTLNRALLEDDSLQHRLIETFKRVAIRNIFSVAEVQTLELQGYRIITELLNQYRPLLVLSADDFQQVISGGHRDLLIESRLAKRLPKKHISAYQLAVKAHQQESASRQRLWEAYYRCRLLQDMVSGMTDQFALEEYRELLALSA
ncbi:dGTPase [Aliiglaciecola sp. CAU 1673]|uniref:dGTPase n=1 Tax=Aliiglaciecola sp. CAU 1673 TaxID=3032595 RepID=UPI0023DBC5CC|nr:dGTPase [Aliiglaciecola sp. CAU 1673]MDF2178405.1 dGTPase [Aliiglaciecola sp. CAU 1673]